MVVFASFGMSRLAGLVRRYSDYGALRALVEGVDSIGMKGKGKVKTTVKQNKPRVKTPAMLERELRKVNERFYPGIKGVSVGEMYSLLGRVRGAGAMKNAFAGSAYNGEQLQTVMSSISKNGKGEFLPTVMLLGRCNSGKSSIVNALVGSEVARVKRYAGLTPCVNVYTIADKFCVVDTPGYGVKGAPWQGQLVMDTVVALKEGNNNNDNNNKSALRKVFVVADAARGAQVSEYDLAVYDMLAGAGVVGDSLCTVLNKCDLLTTVGVNPSASASASASAYAVQSGSPVLCVSALEGAVAALLWAVAAAVGVGNGGSNGSLKRVSLAERVVEERERAKREIAARRADRRARDNKVKKGV